jgi:shikimate dehydrogenase
MTSDPTALYGIIGFPLEHSLSPVMHNAAFKALGVQAQYQRFPIPLDKLNDFLHSLRQENCSIFGLNVTVPYKERVLSQLDTLSPLCQKIGAVNTIVINAERRLQGYNTDAPGFMAHLSELGFNPAGKRIALLGAGGSARAIIATLCMIPDRPQSIRIYNRSEGRLNILIRDLSFRMDLSIVEPASSVDDLNLPLADLLINTTSVGLREDDPLLVDENLIHSNILVYDLIYNPVETKLLQLAQKKGASVSNGLGMLFYQGVLSLEHWANTQLEDEVKITMRNALRKGACQ